MSKRKSLSQSMNVMSSDIMFEDDDDIDQEEGSITDSASAKGSRVSNRAKKAKAIYDPSEHNGPVHKRKKEALEKELLEKAKTPTKVIKHTTGSTKQAEIVSPVSLALNESIKAKALNKLPIESKPLKSADVKKIPAKVQKVIAAKPASPVKKETLIPVVAAVKEPSKRIKARIENKIQTDSDKSSRRAKNQRLDSASTSFSTEDYDKASTIDLKHKSVIPDVRKWSFEQVFDYFSFNLGFNRSDAKVFKDEEIDGEALLIMKRSDIIKTKFQNLKLGVALKMWTHILQFQTGSSDPSQAWK